MSIAIRGANDRALVGTFRPPSVAAISGRYYGQRNNYGGVAATMALVANTLYAVPFTAPRAMALDRLGLNITGAAAGGKLLRLGLYLATPYGLPDVLIVGSGALAADATGVALATVDAKLKAHALYYFACVSDGTPTVTSLTMNVSPFGGNDGTDVGGGASMTRTFAYAALPQAWGTIAAYVGPTPFIVGRAV